MSNEVDVAINFLISILNNQDNYTPEGISELYEIRNGNKKVILEHLQAIYNIVGRAIRELENDK